MTRARVRRLVCGLGFATLLLPSIAMVAPRLAPTAEAAFPGRNGRIVFTVGQFPDVTGQQLEGTDFDDFDLFTVSPSGHGLQRVTDDPRSGDFYPAWSPDGRRIAFTRTDPIGSSSAANDIYVMDPTGGQVTNLTASPLDDDVSPSWSPDGTKIVFSSAHSTPANVNVGGPTEADIYVMDSDGGNVVQLTDDGSDQYEPAWSPQGDVIAYVDDPLIGSSSIRLIHPDGTDGGLVPGGGRNPSWSPDGRRITFSRSSDIWVVNRDGSGLKNLTLANGSEVERSPAWSPDGKWIAFVSNREDDYKLFKMRPDGSDVTRVVDITLTPKTFGGIDWGARP